MGQARIRGNYDDRVKAAVARRQAAVAAEEPQPARRTDRTRAMPLAAAMILATSFSLQRYGF